MSSESEPASEPRSGEIVGASQSLSGGDERVVLWQRALASGASETEAVAWRKQVETRIQVAGGELIARAGTSVCAAFDALELDDAIDLGLSIARDAQAQGARIEAACAIGLGEVLAAGSGDGEAGSVIDRAQLLANAAEAFEVVLDDFAHARAEDSHLFSRVLRAGALGGHAIDRDHPRKRDARAALSALRPVRLPPGTHAAFEHLRALSSAAGQRRIGLRVVQPHVALFWLDELARELQPGLMLRLAPQAAGLQPLGGLQLALQRAGEQLEPLLDAPLRSAVERMRAGAEIARGEAVVALRELLKRATGGGRTFIVLDRMRDIDRPSLAVVAEALQQPCGDPVLFLIADENEGVPSALLRAGEHDDVVIEPLTIDDRMRVAESALSLAPGSDVARRVARLGGDTTLGVWTAARTLVGSGDLVLRGGEGFGFRTKARNTSLPLPIDALLTESAAGLEPAARRVLEALCTAAPCTNLDTVRRVAALDGLPIDLADQGIDQLVREGWVDAHGELGPLEHAVCNAIRNGMPPARASELHRFIAEVLQTQPAAAAGPAFASALLAHHASEGGRNDVAAAALLDAAQAATASGFERMAVRLAAIALKLDASADTKRRARVVARSIDTGPMASSVPPQPRAEPPLPSTAPHAAPADPARDPRAIASSAMRSAIRAIIRRESESAESLIDTAVAAGWGRAGAQRLWSIAQLSKGDLPHAVRVLKQAHVPGASPGTRSREAIAAALILLEAGECMDAVRSALEALASARRGDESRGERAALELLAACYQLLGREPDAERIARAAAR